MIETVYTPVHQDILLVRGDTLDFNFQLQGLAGAVPTALEFTCRQKPTSLTYFFKRVLLDGVRQIQYDASTDTTTYSVRVRPDQTEGLPVGRYYYDLRLAVDNDVITLMNGHLTLTYDITKGLS